MPTKITVDFTDAPPAQGGQGADHFPAGLYPLRIERMESKSNNDGKPQILAAFRVAQGVQAGKKTNDNFTFPLTEKDSKFGKQRFHALLLAMGAKIATGPVTIDIESLQGKIVWAECEDNTIPAKDNYPERTVTKPRAYYSNTEAQAMMAGAQTAAAATTTPPAVQAPAPAPPTPAPTPAPTPSPAPAIQTSATDDTPFTNGVATMPPVQAPVPETLVNGAAASIEQEIDKLFA